MKFGSSKWWMFCKRCSWCLIQLWNWSVLISINISCKTNKLDKFKFYLSFSKTRTSNLSSFVYYSWQSKIKNIVKCAGAETCSLKINTDLRHKIIILAFWAVLLRWGDLSISLREKCQYSELFWSECGKYGQNNSEFGLFLRSVNSHQLAKRTPFFDKTSEWLPLQIKAKYMKRHKFLSLLYPHTHTTSFQRVYDVIRHHTTLHPSWNNAVRLQGRLSL